MNAIVLDLETVPDLTVWQPKEAAEPLDPERCEKCGEPCAETEHMVRKCPKMTRGKCRRPEPSKPEKDEFPPCYAHRIVVAGMLLINEDMPQSMVAWQAGTENAEGPLLSNFNSVMQANPTHSLVTWNGRGFDLPVIEARSFRHCVAQNWYTQEYRNRYNETPNLDLQVAYSGGKPGVYMHMSDAARLIGLPGKNGVDGAMVRALVENGQIAAVANYCLTDVVQEAYLYFRYRVVRGYLTRDQYVAAVDKLEEIWKGQPGFENFHPDVSRLKP